MSTIASPRQTSNPLSLSLTTPTSSSRTSIDTITSLPSPSSHQQPPRPPQQRRNRAALRDYYGLKDAGAGVGAAPPADPSNDKRGQRHEEAEDVIEERELDREGFDAEKYVKEVLAKEGLEGVLRAEGGLINEIKSLDGERKALVYDNYSKLITATDTIRKMRTNMDPLTPTTSTLSPAIAHIAETAGAVASRRGEQKNSRAEVDGGRAETESSVRRKQSQQETVRWVLDTPRRLRERLDGNRRDEAVQCWEEVRALLEKWKGVEGVDKLSLECESILEKGSCSSSDDPSG